MKKWTELCCQNLLIKPSYKQSSNGNSDLDGIVDFLLQKRESDKSHDQAHVFKEKDNNDNSNNDDVYVNEQTSEQGE